MHRLNTYPREEVPNNMAATKSKPVPRKDKICVWTFPEGTQPAVRVQVEGGKIKAEDLLEIAGKTLEINANSLPFFGLFRGIENPTKKYGNNEMIYLPCRYVISIQRWSFDVPREQKYLKTDAGAMRLLCVQCVEDIRAGRLKPKPEHIPLMKEYRNPAFPCDKQYVELCQTMYGYGYVFLNDCTVQNDVKVKDVRLTTGMKVDLIANRRGLMIKSSKSMLKIEILPDDSHTLTLMQLLTISCFIKTIPAYLSFSPFHYHV